MPIVSVSIRDVKILPKIKKSRLFLSFFLFGGFLSFDFGGDGGGVGVAVVVAVAVAVVSQK